MHDLVRDLCISKAREEGFAQSIILKGEDNDGTNLENVNCRRLFVSLVGSRFKIDESNVSSLFPQLRSICLHTSSAIYDAQFRVLKLIIEKLKLVKVLEIPRRCDKPIGKMRNLIHLRFLKLGVIPPTSSLSDMRCLQTLNLRTWIFGLPIPDSIWGMEQLRHLYLPLFSKCVSSKQRVGDFRNLQTLVNFPLSKFDVRRNLAKFNGVRKLVIAGYLLEEIDKTARSQGISFNRLQSLSCNGFGLTDKVHLDAISRASPLLYRLRCSGPIHSAATGSFSWPSNLTKLVLAKSEFDERDIWLLAKLQSLRVLFLLLHSFAGKEMIFHENDFPQLRHLKLESLTALKACIVQEGALPSLVCLEIEDCEKLESVTHGPHFLKQLKEIKVKYMPYSFVQSLKTTAIRDLQL